MRKGSVFMSLSYNKEIKCRYCEKSFHKTIWHNINTETNPEMKEPLLSGKLFFDKCPHCQRPAVDIYSLLYHNSESNTMIYFVDNQSDMKKAILTLDEQDAHITKRIVSSIASLREKDMIFSNNLDDRVIECLKVIATRKIQEKDPDIGFNQVFLTECENTYKFEALNSSLSALMPINPSDDLIEQIIKLLPDKNNAYCIDANWALSFISKNAHILVDDLPIYSAECEKQPHPKLLSTRDDSKKQIKQPSLTKTSSKLSQATHFAVKCLIWVLSFFFIVGMPNAIITELNGNLGGIPSMILAGGAFWTAKILCKKWDTRKSSRENISKQEDSFQTEYTVSVAETPPCKTSPVKVSAVAKKKKIINKFTITIAILCILLSVSIGVNAYMAQSISVLEEDLNSAKGKWEYYEDKCEYFKDKYNDEIDYRIKLKINLSFYEEHVVIVPDDNTYKYHIYGCKYCDTSSFWAYNTEAARDRGYSPCKYCCS